MKKFIDLLKEKHHSNDKFIDSIAAILDIKYDAAYRRINGLAKFSLEESILLAEHYHISLDVLKTKDDEKKLFLPKENSIKNLDEITNYLENSHKNLLPFLKKNSTNIIYSSKDIPIFYTLGNGNLARFKMYVWCWMLDEKFSKLQLSFSDFSLPQKLIDVGEKLKNEYQNLNCTEFWNDSVIQSTLFQLNYFSDLGILTEFEKKNLLSELHQILLHLENRLTQTDKNYKIYLNELILMNNSIFFQLNNKVKLLLPLTIFGFIELEDENIIKEQIRFYELQKQNSISLSDGNQKNRKLFFNKLYSQLN